MARRFFCMFTPTPRVEDWPMTTRISPVFILSAMSFRFSRLTLPSTITIWRSGMPSATSFSTRALARLCRSTFSLIRFPSPSSRSVVRVEASEYPRSMKMTCVASGWLS